MELFDTIEAELDDFLDEPVFLWRLEQLEQAGYDEDVAREIAGRADIDLHAAVDLCSRGCPPATAFAIIS